MAKLKDGVYKLIGTAIGNDAYVLLAGGGSKLASDFKFPTSNITPLTEYIKNEYTEESLTILSTADSLNSALSKLEYKADLGVSAHKALTLGTNSDNIINTLNEIIKAFGGITEDETILNKFIPRAGTLSGKPITGTLHFKNVDGILIEGAADSNRKIWEICGTNLGQWGFHELYKGTGSSNDNSLILYSHNLTGTHVPVRKVYQDGSIDIYTSTVFSITPKVLVDSKLVKVSLENHTHSNYVTLNTVQTITGMKTFNSLIVPANNYIYAWNGKGGAMLLFDEKRTILGTFGDSSPDPTHIRSTTSHMTIGKDNTVQYHILDTGNFSTYYTIPNPTDYYWANIKISDKSNLQTNPTFSTLTTVNNSNLDSDGGRTIAKLGVNASNPYGLYIRAQSSGDLYLQSLRLIDGSTEYFNLILNPNGRNVGIGTSTLPEKLTVNGYIAASGYKLSNNIKNVLLGDGTSCTLASLKNSHDHSYYWANIGILKTASTETEPTFKTVKSKNFTIMHQITALAERGWLSYYLGSHDFGIYFKADPKNGGKIILQDAPEGIYLDNSTTIKGKTSILGTVLINPATGGTYDLGIRLAAVNAVSSIFFNTDNTTEGYSANMKAITCDVDGGFRFRIGQNGLPSIVEFSKTGQITALSYITSTHDGNHILMDDGTRKALSDLNSSHNHDSTYLKRNGTNTYDASTLKFSTSTLNIESATGTWYLKISTADTTDLTVHRFTFSERQGKDDYIELFGVDGNGDLFAKNRKVSLNGHKHIWQNITDTITTSNEFNFIPESLENGNIFINFASHDTNKVTKKPITQYNFSRGQKDYTYANLLAGGYIVAGSSASLILLGSGAVKNINELDVNSAVKDGLGNTITTTYTTKTELLYSHAIYSSKIAFSASNCVEYCTRSTTVLWLDSDIKEVKNSKTWKIGNIITFIIHCTDGTLYISKQKVVNSSSLLPLSNYYIINSFANKIHTHSYTDLTGSGTVANQVICSTGVANKWELKTLGSRAFDNTEYLPLHGKADDSDKLDGLNESEFLRYRGAIDIAYSKLTNTEKNAEGYLNPLTGIYTRSNSGDSSMFIAFTGSGSTSGLDILTHYSRGSILYRHRIDANRIDGDWITLWSNYNLTKLSQLTNDLGFITTYKNYYLTGVSGSGNGTVTFTRQGLGSLTWDASHNHDDRYAAKSLIGIHPSDEYTTDANTIPNMLIYYGEKNGAKNIPETAGTLFSISETDTFLQIFGNSAKNTFYIRNKWTNAGSWYKLWTTLNFNPGNYLPLKGGTMEGPINFPNATALPQSSKLQYVTGITPWGSDTDGQLQWESASTFVGHYAPTKIGGGASGDWGINITGTAATLKNFTVSPTTSRSIDSIVTNGVWYFSANAPTNIGFSDYYGAVWSLAYSSSYVGQIAQDYKDGSLYVRGRKGSTTWSAWDKVITVKNYMNQDLQFFDFTTALTNEWLTVTIPTETTISSGTYIILVYVNNGDAKMRECYFSGIMSWYNNTVGDTGDPEGDEIILHRAGKWYDETIYLRTYVGESGAFKLEMAASNTLASATYTFKLKKIC